MIYSEKNRACFGGSNLHPRRFGECEGPSVLVDDIVPPVKGVTKGVNMTINAVSKYQQVTRTRTQQHNTCQQNKPLTRTQSEQRRNDAY